MTVGNVSWTAGKVGGALYLDGSTYVAIGSQPLFSVPAVTVTAWVRPFTYGVTMNGGIVVNEEGESQLAVSSTGVQYAAANTAPGFQWQASTFLPPLYQWTHLAWSYSSADAAFKLYANGALVSTLLGSGDIGDALPAMNELWIGARQADSNQFFAGDLDEIHLYDRALTATEVQAVYDATK